MDGCMRVDVFPYSMTRSEYMPPLPVLYAWKMNTCQNHVFCCMYVCICKCVYIYIYIQHVRMSIYLHTHTKKKTESAYPSFVAHRS